MILSCPAKLNLFLAVGPPDHRGWHPLRTVFQSISLYDELELTPADLDSFHCDDPSVPEENTVTRAWRLLAEVLTLPKMRVELRKRIPAQSGLGGGSSDAASFLRGAIELSGGVLPEHELSAIAQAIGADVPFFLLGGRALAEGYGERLTPIGVPLEHYVIVRPAVGCSTPKMFRALDELSYPWREFPARDELHNDFERVAPCECLDLIERLQVHGARDAALSGSGSAVFGRFDSQSDAEAAAERLRGEGSPWVWTAHSLPAWKSISQKDLYAG